MYPETGAYTISIESLYQEFKKGHLTEKARLNSYMEEFIWREMDGGNALYHLWSQIAEHYSLSLGSV